MKQNIHFIGQLLEVKPLEYENKKTKIVTKSTELTMLLDTWDDDGYRRVSVDTVKADEDYFEEFFEKKGSYVAVPYLFTRDDFGESFKFDRSMPIVVLDKNPFDIKSKTLDDKKKV